MSKKRFDLVQFFCCIVYGACFRAFSLWGDGTCLFVYPAQPFLMKNRIYNCQWPLIKKYSRFLSQFIKIACLNFKNTMLILNICNKTVNGNFM